MKINRPANFPLQSSFGFKGVARPPWVLRGKLLPNWAAEVFKETHESDACNARIRRGFLNAFDAGIMCAAFRTVKHASVVPRWVSISVLATANASGCLSVSRGGKALFVQSAVTWRAGAKSRSRMQLCRQMIWCGGIRKIRTRKLDHIHDRSTADDSHGKKISVADTGAIEGFRRTLTRMSMNSSGSYSAPVEAESR